MRYHPRPMPRSPISPLIPGLSLALLTLACTPSKQAPQSDAPDAGHHHPNGHQAGGHGVNEHGYKGHRFENPEEWAAHFESPERTAWQKPDEVVASLGLAADAKVADIGAGTGYFAVRLAAAAPEGAVFAVDIEPEMVAWLDQRAEKEGLANLRAVQGAPESANLPEAVDLAFMCNVFHHIADPQAYFEALAGSLSPEARVVIVDFRKDNPDEAPGPPAKMRMRPEEIRASMEAAGYEFLGLDDELLEYQYVISFRRP